MSARKPVRIGDLVVLLTEEQTEELRLDVEAAIREWDDERAQELAQVLEAEGNDRAAAAWRERMTDEERAAGVQRD